MSSEQINTKASRTVMIMAITATFASLAFGYDTGVINGALPYMAEPDQLNLTPALEGLVVSAISFALALLLVLLLEVVFLIFWVVNHHLLICQYYFLYLLLVVLYPLMQL